MFTIVFQVFSCVFACVLGACFECFSFFVRILQLFHLDVLKVDRMCCACCNVSHLLQLSVGGVGALCMEGSGVASVEGCRKQGSVGSGTGGPHLCMQQARGRPDAGGPFRRPGTSVAVNVILC
jgi:hypothetical protein